jgi:hypothetical protein
MQRKEPFFRPAADPADRLGEYRDAVARLRSLTTNWSNGRSTRSQPRPSVTALPC